MTAKPAKEPAPEHRSTARASLGHTESLLIKMHPDIKAHVEAQAAASYCSAAEWVRRLIIDDMQMGPR